MTEDHLQLPKSAFVNKYVAKSKFYEHAVVSKRLKQTFIDKISRITWKYKLAENTINISKTKNVTEIQIFEIELKQLQIPKKALKLIDKSISYQILYRFVYDGNEAWGITLKESSKKEDWYFSEWNENLTFDLSGLNLETVYHNLVKAFLKEEAKTRDNFKSQVEIDREIKRLETEIERLDKKIKKEKQFNRKVEMNQRRLEIIQTLKQLKEQ